MKRLPLLIAMVIAGVFFAFNTTGTNKSEPPTKYERILRIVGEILTQGHYSPKDINDEFSKKVFVKYFEELDPDKNIFLQSDITSLGSYSTKIDDEIKGTVPVQFFLEASKIFNKRREEVAVLYKDILSKPFNFSVNETVTTDSKKLMFASSPAERREQWRKRLKYLTLQRFVELQETRDSNKGKEGFVVKSDSELEKEAREKVSTTMNRIFERYRLKFNDDDKFSVFVNTITNMMDPHTEFFPPVEKRSFDESLSGSFYGIGAQLTNDEGNIKIASVLPGGPAKKSEQIEVGDIIVKVAQGKEAPVELTGYDVTDAVKIIRGQKGTTVTLTLRKKDGTLKVVSLVRDKIVQDESYVRSAVIKQGNSKIGYIFLPDFYANFDDPNDPHRSSVDVAAEVKKLKAENVDGIVIDLRNNGGGALYDAIQITGLFIDQGPVVQVKDRQGQPQIMRDKEGGVLYDGPLAVMVNEFSASASEIFAAAMQDYGRAVIIGSTSTYGKGTVQRPIGLDPSNFLATNSDLGSLKLTFQKFYRVNGGSTQLKGVVPDIIIPDYLEYLKLREKDNEDALPYDEIARASIKAWQPGYDLQTIKNIGVARIASDSVFQLIKQKTDVLAKNNDKEYPLQIDKFKKEQKANREVIKEVEKLIKSDKNDIQVNYLTQDAERYESADKDKTERYKRWLNDLGKDIYVNQAVKVVNDVVNQQNLAKAKGAKTF